MLQTLSIWLVRDSDATARRVRVSRLEDAGGVRPESARLRAPLPGNGDENPPSIGILRLWHAYGLMAGIRMV
jgi:hypothetical protein